MTKPTRARPLEYSADNQRSGRIVLPDLVRAFALLGIALVNVAYFAYPGDITYHYGGLQTQYDLSAYGAVTSLFLFKSYTLFSFMFGVGLAYQMHAAERRKKAFGPVYFRRLAGLMLLGILHVSLAFVGDILIIYSLLGVLLFFFRHSSQQTLLRIGVIMITLQVLIALLFAAGIYMTETYTPSQWRSELDTMQVTRETAHLIYASSSSAEIASQRWSDWVRMLLFAVPLQAPGAFAFFVIGLAAVRANVLSDANAVIWKKSRRLYLPVGIIMSVIGSYITLSAQPVSSRAMIGYAILLLAAPLSSAGYIGLIAKWSQRPMNSVKSFLARGGSASLTAYLLQSLVMSLIFCAYGLGLFGKPGAFVCISIALATAVFSIVFSSLWRSHFDRGPLEALLRRWTYLDSRTH